MTTELKAAEEEFRRLEQQDGGAESKSGLQDQAESKGMQSKAVSSSSTKRTMDEDMLPYTIEHNPASRDAITPQVTIRFAISPE